MSSGNDPVYRVLVVDDEEDLREMLVEELEDAGFSTVAADNGVSALEVLEEKSDDVAAILLDRNMPKMDGFQLFDELRSKKEFREIPVIFQTAATSPQDIIAGLEKGAYYYITKPYDFDVLFAVIRSAIEDRNRLDNIRHEVDDQQKAMMLVNAGTFEFSTLEEAHRLATMLSLACPNPDSVAFGLLELFINSIEHGNLEIAYEEKTKLVISGQWQNEVKRRLSLPQYNNRKTKVRFNRDGEKVTFHITDEGAGFDWAPYMEFDPSRAMEPNGRGIALANSGSFSSLTFIGKGNEVVAAVTQEQGNTER
jgi:DNA-binding response OmpR family regulator